MKRRLIGEREVLKVGDYYKKAGVVVGVMVNDAQYVSLSDQANYYVSYDTALSLQSSYSIQGVTGWRIPTKEEWADMYSKKSAINSALVLAGSKIADDWYWTSTPGGGGFYSCSYVDGGYWSPGSRNRVRLIRNI